MIITLCEDILNEYRCVRVCKPRYNRPGTCNTVNASNPGFMGDGRRELNHQGQLDVVLEEFFSIHAYGSVGYSWDSG